MAAPHIDSDGLTPEQARYKSGQLRLIQPSGDFVDMHSATPHPGGAQMRASAYVLGFLRAGYIQHIPWSSAGIEPAGSDGRIGEPAVTKAADWVITGMTPFL